VRATTGEARRISGDTVRELREHDPDGRR